MVDARRYGPGEGTPGDALRLNEVLHEPVPEKGGRPPHALPGPRPGLWVQVHRRPVHEVESSATRGDGVGVPARLPGAEDDQRYDGRAGDEREVGGAGAERGKLAVAARALGVDTDHSPVAQHLEASFERRRVDLVPRQRDLA